MLSGITASFFFEVVPQINFCHGYIQFLHSHRIIKFGPAVTVADTLSLFRSSCYMWTSATAFSLPVLRLRLVLVIVSLIEFSFSPATAASFLDRDEELKLPLLLDFDDRAELPLLLLPRLVSPLS